MQLRNLATAFLAVFLLLIAGIAMSAPGNEPWIEFNSSSTVTETTLVNSGSARFWVLNNGDFNSKVITVNAPEADICFDTDIASASIGSARVTAYRAITYEGSDTSWIVIPAIPSDGSNCVKIVRGRYWVEIDTAPSGSEVAHVLIQGR